MVRLLGQMIPGLLSLACEVPQKSLQDQAWGSAVMPERTFPSKLPTKQQGPQSRRAHHLENKRLYAFVRVGR